MYRFRRLGPLVVAAISAACSSPASDPRSDGESQRPYVLVLGTAQDGGLPHIGCTCVRCARARSDLGFRRNVTALLLADPRDGKRYLFDATPDLPAQLEMARPHPPTRVSDSARPPLLEGVFLTHAHIGHYTGLMFFGPEAYSARSLPTFGSQRMVDFLTRNGPWSLLVEKHNIDLHLLTPGAAEELGSSLSVLPVLVPHRDEFSDTFAFVIRGPSRALLYLPDIDKWEKWTERIEDWIARVDYALLDGSFFADGEISGRSMKDIPHPFIQESIERFQSLDAKERAKVYFTHLNHSNPAVDPDSPAHQEILQSGMHVAHERMVFEL